MRVSLSYVRAEMQKPTGREDLLRRLRLLPNIGRGTGASNVRGVGFAINDIESATLGHRIEGPCHFRSAAAHRSPRHGLQSPVAPSRAVDGLPSSQRSPGALDQRADGGRADVLALFTPEWGWWLGGSEGSDPGVGGCSLSKAPRFDPLLAPSQPPSQSGEEISKTQPPLAISTEDGSRGGAETRRLRDVHSSPTRLRVRLFEFWNLVKFLQATAPGAAF